MKIGFLITARLKSSRLPLKLLKDLYGKTVIERVIDRCKKVQGISEIVLCTSNNPQDRPLVDIAKANNIYYFIANEEDVLKRLWGAARFYELDYFLSITGDNPLFSIYYANLIVNSLKNEDRDYVFIDGLALGTALYGLKTKAAELVCVSKKMVNTEIWGCFFKNPDFFNINKISAEGNLAKPKLRLTLDYPEDYELLASLYNSIPFEDILDLDRVVSYLESNPVLLKINSNCLQRDIDAQSKSEIDKHFAEKKESILKLKDKIYGIRA